MQTEKQFINRIRYLITKVNYPFGINDRLQLIINVANIKLASRHYVISNRKSLTNMAFKFFRPENILRKNKQTNMFTWNKPKLANDFRMVSRAPSISIVNIVESFGQIGRSDFKLANYCHGQ